MFLFLVLGLPLAFALLFIRAYPREEGAETQRTLLRGLALSLPLWFIARFLGGLLPDFWGSNLVLIHEWLDRTLPYAALPGLGYALYWHYGEKLERGRLLRRMTTFYAACLAPMGFGEMLRSFLSPEVHVLFLLPLILATLVLALPLFIEAWLAAWTSRRVFLGIGAFIASLSLSTPLLFLANRNFIPPFLIVLGALALAARIALPRLAARPVNPT